MKQRHTYLLPEVSGVDPEDIYLSDSTLQFAKAGQAAEEWRLTLGWEFLPDELQALLQNVRDLHVRYSSSANGQRVSPLISQLPSGLHVFVSPRESEAVVPICDILRALSLFGEEDTILKCHSLGESFSTPASTAHSPAYQWYQYWPMNFHVGSSLLAHACKHAAPKTISLDACEEQAQELADAGYADLDFDPVARTFTITAMWKHADVHEGSLAIERAVRPLRKLNEGGRVEVGILGPEKAGQVDDLALGGFLAVVGEDEKPRPTRFSFPARHHPLPDNTPATFRASFQQPTGLHPKLDITLPRQNLSPPEYSCTLNAYLTLPSALFIDRYQLADLLFLESQNLKVLRSLTGEQDLEAPDWVIKRWGSAALIELAKPPSDSGAGEWTVTIPTHLRYLNTSNPDTAGYDDGKSTLHVPWPVLFWACEAEGDLEKSINPFERRHLGYDALFDPNTLFYHIAPTSNATKLVEEVHVPVLNPANAGWVQMGTLVAVVAGFAWVVWQLLSRTRAQKPAVAPERKRE